MKIIMKISTLTAIMLLNTGCIFGLFEDTTVVPLKQSNIKSNQKLSTSSVKSSLLESTSSMEIVPECSDDIDANSGCQKKPIETDELKPKKVLTKVGGEIHRLKSIQGKKITIIERPTGYLFPEFKNKIVILEMFGKDCSHCIKEMPTMNKLRRKYRKHLKIVAIQVEGKMSSREANRLIRSHKIYYPIISGQTATNLQYNVQNTYGWTGILPFILVIKNGVTEFSYRGSVSYNEINKDIRSLLR